MSRRQIVFHGNCQVGYIARVYAEQIAPRNGDRARYFDLNHTDFTNPGVIEAFYNADVLVDQVFDVPDAIPCELVERAKKRLRVPNLRGDFLWPFGTREPHPRHESLPEFAKYYYAYEFGDSYLNRMIAKGATPETAVKSYLDVDFRRQRNLPRIFEISIDRQERRDKIAGVAISDFILRNMRSELLFYSPGHPSEHLLLLIARPVLQELAGRDLAERALDGQFQGFPHWRTAPVHPNVAETLSLNFITDRTLFSVFDEGYFTFEEYALRYMRCDCVPELTEAVKRFSQVDGETLLRLASTALERAPMSALAHRLCCQALRRLGRPSMAIDPALRASSLEPENPQNMQELIAVLLQSGDLATAERWARIAASRFRREAPIQLGLCDVLAARGKTAEAVTIANIAAELHPGHGFTLLRAARHLLAANEFAQATALADRLAQLGTNAAEVAQLQSDILERTGQRNAAIEALRKAIAQRPHDAHLHGKLAHLLNQDNDTTGAELAYRQAIAIDPRPAGFYGGLSDAVDRQGRRREAISVLEGALAAGYGDVHIIARLAHLLFLSGDFERAEATYRQAIARNAAVSGFHVGLAETLERQRRWPEAAMALRTALACPDAKPDLHARLGHLLYLQGDMHGSESEYRAAIARQPGSYRYYCGLADALDAQGQHREALATLRVVTDAGRSDPHFLARVANLLSRQRDFDSAETIYRDAIALEPRFAGLYVGLAENFDRQGKHEPAVAAIRQAMQAGHADARMHAHLGYYLGRTGDLKSAEDAYRAAIDLDPSTPAYAESLQRIRAQKGAVMLS